MFAQLIFGVRLNIQYETLYKLYTIYKFTVILNIQVHIPVTNTLYIYYLYIKRM